MEEVKTELKQEEVNAPAVVEEKTAIEPIKENIGFEDFMKMDLRIAKVLTCEKVKKSKKLLKMTLDIGTEERTVVSGISLHYTPEEMVGKSVIYLANLAPKKLMGIESSGMVLAASDTKGNLVVPNVEGMEPGSLVK